jgi:hypothetical protein
MLIRELIYIQERVNKDDFVLKLTAGVADPGTTLGSYVVTKELVQNFDDALGFIKGAIDSNKSRGSYLHGSFGSGKSHFMAVLNLLLQGHHEARALPKLAPVVKKHDDWLKGKKFLMVPYHMIGAKTLEDRIFEGYVDWVKEHHPDAPIPPLFRSQAILENADGLRDKMGDEAFFKALNQGQQSGDARWGALTGGWTAESYAEAAEDPTSQRHGDLVSDLVQHLITSVQQEGDYLDLDKGLAALSRHAKSLKYDGVILFLDELVLWLASRSGSVDFLNQEVNKLAKLVEAQEMRRPVPIISFIARQRDLRELVGDNVAGAANLNFLDQLKYFEGRFETIRMGDSNLPEIAAERLLKPVNADARKQIDAKFEETVAVRQEVREVLMTTNSNPEAWRNLYPFSPALVDTLVAVSSLLQRERTALRILLQLLVDQRDTMQLGELVPVGDLYDQIARGDDAFSSEMKKHFQTADKLYRQNLKPMLEATHDLSFAAAEELPQDDPKRVALRNDDRLIKTVLLAALAPEVETLRSLTPARLAALNHGTIKTRIQGREASIAEGKFREWAGRVGQLKVDESTPPIISLQLTGVDVDGIIDKAASQDNFGNRLRCIKEILYKQLELRSQDSLLLEHNFRWRGTDRRCKVIFKNVWEADFDLLESSDGDWKLVIDYPLDADPNKGPSADRAQLQKYREERGSTRAVVWLPSFFSQQALQDLGKLVKLETILAEHAYDGYVSDLSMQDKTTAKSILINQRDALRNRMVTHLQTAYGLREDKTGVIDTMRNLDGVDHFQSLDSGLQLKVPGATHLQGAMGELLEQALSSQHPQHPEFDDSVKLSATFVQKVLDVFLDALQQSEGRIEVEKSQRDMIRMIANPLKLGEMAPQYFVPGEHWKDHFRRKAPDGLDGVKVSELRAWIGWGIPPMLENLIILACAAQLNCSFSLHGNSYHASLKDLPADCKLKTQELPAQEEWDNARLIQDSLLGLAGLPKLMTAQTLDDFSTKVRAEAAGYEKPVNQLVSLLASEAVRQGVEEDFDRLNAAKEAQRFLALVKPNHGCALIKAMAGFKSDSPDEAISTSIKGTESVIHVLPMNRKTLDMALGLESPLKEEAQKLETELLSALRFNEYVAALAPVVDRVNTKALAILQRQIQASKGAGQPVTVVPVDGGNVDGVTIVVPPTPGIGRSVVSKKAGWAGSDEAEVLLKYGDDRVALERNRKKVSELKTLYRASQVEGDVLPAWVPDSLVELLLEVHLIELLGEGGEDERSNMIVLTPTLHALMHACDDARIDLRSGVLSIPSRGIERKITVNANHNG